MSSQFAKGPYTYKAVVGLPDEEWWSILADEGKRELAILPRIDMDSEANAALFAAAPALYEALKEIRKACSDGSRIGDICDKATALVDQSTEGQATETR